MKNASNADSDELQGLREDEWNAGLLVSRCVGASPEAYDVNGRQGAVDIVMTYPDGHRAALEITSHAADGVRRRESQQGKDSNHWKAPGRHSWFATVTDPQIIPELRSRYSGIVLALEEMGVSSSEDVDVSSSSVPDERGQASLPEALQWLVDCDVSFHVVSKEPKVQPVVYLLSEPVAPIVGTGLAGLASAVSAILAAENQKRHIEKLRNCPWPERHLYIDLYEGGLPFPLEVALMDEEIKMPAGRPPRLPRGITHLWLAPRFSPFLIEVCGRQWRFHLLKGLEV